MIATSATITNPVRKFSYSAGVSGAPRLGEHGGGEFLPGHVSAEWVADDDGWQLQWIRVSGARIKADGKPGSRETWQIFSDFNTDDWPAWLVQLVADQAPKEA